MSDYGIETEGVNEEVDEPNYEIGNFVSSLHHASELVGHNNPQLLEAFNTAKQYVGNAEDYDTTPVDASLYTEADNEEVLSYLGNVVNDSQVVVAQAKQLKLGHDVISGLKRVNEQIVKAGHNLAVSSQEDYKGLTF